MKRNTILRKIMLFLFLVLIGQMSWAQSKKQQIATLQSTVDSLINEMTTLQGKVQTLNADATQLNNEVNDLKRDKKLLRQRIADTSKVCRTLRSQITSLSREKNNVEQKLSEAERQRAEALRSGTFQLGPDMMKKLSVENYKAMYEIQVHDCQGWSFSMDGRYRFYNFEDCIYGVMVALDNRGQEIDDQKYICTFSFDGGMSSGLNQFAFYDTGTMVIFNAGQADPAFGLIPTLHINDQECNMRVLKRVEPSLF